MINHPLDIPTNEIGFLLYPGFTLVNRPKRAIIANPNKSTLKDMKHRSTFFSILLTAIALLFSTSALVAQDNRAIIQDYLNEHRHEMKMQSSDVSHWVISKEYYSQSTNVTHIYIKQTLNGLEIVNGGANFNLLEGVVFSMGNRLVHDIAQKSNDISPSLSAEQAILAAAEQLNIAVLEPLSVITILSATESVFDKSGISLEDIPVKLVYQYTEKDEVRLAWDLNISTLDAQNWWSVRVDAHTGEVIGKNNWTSQCNIEHCVQANHISSTDCSSHNAVPKPEEMRLPPVVGNYNVFAIPVESPIHGPRTLVSDPNDPIASPFGWHDDNGILGNDYTITRGNNVHAYEDIQDNNTPGESPDGGAALIFDYVYDIEQPAIDNLGAAITNLFYMNNIMHDVWYQYGFDEPSGNFQEENYTNSGGAENDYVRAEAQDGSGTNNANFSTPIDGQRPRMQMYLWSPSINSNFTVNAPPSDIVLDVDYSNSLAGFGPDIPTVPIIADLVLVTDDSGGDPNDACETISNGADLEGKIAVIRRGECEFGFKILAAENEGAVAVIIVNNVSGDPVTMGAGALGNSVTIPSLMLSSVQGEPIIDALENGDLVNGTIVNDSAGLIAADSDFDNGIVAHEYGHGISNRLTGGGNNSNCLGNDEQMGEGWSDWFGIMLTINESDQAEDPRGVGTYVNDQEPDGNGIRPAPYSTSPLVNNFTYAATNNENLTSQPHGIGFVWSTMLWDMNWALIDVYGFDPDMYNGTGGNNIAMQLVIDGLKLQPCSPGFVDGRDAILEADMLNYDGAHQCLIWEVFANRGLGFSADQGSAFSRFDQDEAFDLPPLDISINAEETALTTDNANAGVTYQWIDCSDDTDIAGETEQSYSPESNGEYAVTIFQNDCSATSECVSFVGFVGIEDIIAANVSISPNPAQDFLQIDFGSLKSIESLSLLDAEGRIVYSQNTISDTILRIDISEASSGMYMLQVNTEQGSSVFKVMVE